MGHAQGLPLSEERMCIGLHTFNLAELKWTSEDSLTQKMMLYLMGAALKLSYNILKVSQWNESWQFLLSAEQCC